MNMLKTWRLQKLTVKVNCSADSKLLSDCESSSLVTSIERQRTACQNWSVNEFPTRMPYKDIYLALTILLSPCLYIKWLYSGLQVIGRPIKRMNEYDACATKQEHAILFYCSCVDWIKMTSYLRTNYRHLVVFLVESFSIFQYREISRFSRLVL